MTQHNKGFIALFFTLGVSSVLMAYVVVSSEKVFDYVRIRENFIYSKKRIESELRCADQYINVLIQIYALPEEFGECDIVNPQFIRINSDTIDFSFIINTTVFKGTIFQGFISELSSFGISL